MEKIEKKIETRAKDPFGSLDLNEDEREMLEEIKEIKKITHDWYEKFGGKKEKERIFEFNMNGINGELSYYGLSVEESPMFLTYGESSILAKLLTDTFKDKKKFHFSFNNLAKAESNNLGGSYNSFLDSYFVFIGDDYLDKMKQNKDVFLYDLNLRAFHEALHSTSKYVMNLLKEDGRVFNTRFMCLSVINNYLEEGLVQYLTSLYGETLLDKHGIYFNYSGIRNNKNGDVIPPAILNILQEKKNIY